MKFFKTPLPVRLVFPQYTWRRETEEKVIYLTFDDGPIPEVTPMVLDYLKVYQAKATFFCVGENLFRYPKIGSCLIKEGHLLGNHTFHHLKGWETATDTYIQDIRRCQDQIDALQPNQRQKLFRPPYGRIKREQFNNIKMDYRVIMWDILTYDYEASLSPNVILNQVLKKTKAGSIVVFHDSLKAQRNMAYVLPRFLEYFAHLGYRFESL